MSWLREYHDKCAAGDIVVGTELMDELDNLIEDLESGEWEFDTSEADLRIEFMESFVRLTKSPFYGKPMVLMLWQKAFIEALYSFYKPGTDEQRFKKAILLIARKNTKSETCAGLGLTELMVGEPGADLVCSSNDDAQASIIYEAINTMREMFDPKDELTHKNISKIRNVLNGSSVFKLSDRTRNKEGRNIDWAILDESHEMKDNVIAKSIEQSQSLKKSPKFINITTEGFVVGGYLDEELAYARKVIAGEIDDATLLPWLYTQDSEREVWEDRSSWVKSNPTLGVVKKWSYLDDQIAKARLLKSERPFVLAKDFNIKQNNAQAWLRLEDYDYPSAFDPEETRGMIGVGAVDLSETTDLTCAKLLLDDGERKMVLTKYFVPEEKVANDADKDAGAKYREWAADGLIEVTPGADNDLTLVADWFYQVYRELGVYPLKIGYDQRFAKEFLKRAEEYGFETEMVLQNSATLSNAMKLLEADLIGRRVLYGDNPIDKWCLGNTAVKTNDLGQVLAVKVGDAPEKRIDGAVTKIILWEMHRRYRTELRDANGIR